MLGKNKNKLYFKVLRQMGGKQKIKKTFSLYQFKVAEPPISLYHKKTILSSVSKKKNFLHYTIEFYSVNTPLKGNKVLLYHTLPRM